MISAQHDKTALLLGARKILVIDDEPYTRKVIKTLLTSIGVKSIQEAADGRAGLEIIPTFVPDVVLCDWEMPGLDGPGFVRAVRAALFLARIASVRMSARACAAGERLRPVRRSMPTVRVIFGPSSGMPTTGAGALVVSVRRS